MKRDLLSLNDFSQEEILQILDLAEKVKQDKTYAYDLLTGKSIGLVFQKPSNRTRTSFDVGINQLGGHCVYLAPQEINLGVRESTSDVAKTLSRYLDGIVARTHTHQDVRDLAEHSSVPVVNGLCDLYHPCQALTDIFSIKEKLGSLEGVTMAYIGDGNNVCHSLMLACAKVGINLNIATPEGYEPDQKVVTLTDKYAQETGVKILVGYSAQDMVKNADVIYSDVWVSMGQEDESHKRLTDFHNFQINRELVATANTNYIFMHCLPAHRGQEVTEDIIDGEHSIVFDQAENRLHTQKAILIFLMKSL
ncbi:Ornithine carbamoyltransferase [hydrothermal vent metagenome]|uniref:ornithine carbamoyltransferase n=1 Tax=hydrothermal vent metagenome TaxID=652676 RepID=A0A3B1CWP0_9ZZZZ